MTILRNGNVAMSNLKVNSNARGLTPVTAEETGCGEEKVYFGATVVEGCYRGGDVGCSVWMPCVYTAVWTDNS